MFLCSREQNVVWGDTPLSVPLKSAYIPYRTKVKRILQITNIYSPNILQFNYISILMFSPKFIFPKFNWFLHFRQTFVLYSKWMYSTLNASHFQLTVNCFFTNKNIASSCRWKVLNVALAWLQHSKNCLSMRIHVYVIHSTTMHITTWHSPSFSIQC